MKTKQLTSLRLPFLFAAPLLLALPLQAAGLHDAAESGDVDALQTALQAKQDLNILNEQGQTPLHVAASAQQVAFVRALLQAGADRGIPDGENQLPFHMTADKEIKALLLENVKGDFQEQTKEFGDLIAAVTRASEAWKSAFNAGDSAGCAQQYEEDATMHARPFGTFVGREAIQGFWQGLIDGGYAEVAYIDPSWMEVVNETSVIIRSGWRMNNASGFIHRELWVLGEDGEAKLRQDDFEVLGQ